MTNIEKNPEYLGYRVLYGFFAKIGRKFIKISDEFYFTMYRLKFGQRNDDIYIVTYPKSGTTVMQVILYQLTSNGDMSFKHIYDVSPWIRNHSFKKKEPLEFPSPRLIKSHEAYDIFEKTTKGRFIYVYRNGMDVAVSQYNQTLSYLDSNLSFEKFVKEFLDDKSKTAWFRFNKDWLRNKWKRPILYVRYEDLINDKRTQIQRIVNFLGLKVDDKTIERAMEFSSFEYMKQNEEKFGEQPKTEPSKKVFDQFIRKGKVGEGIEMFSDEQKREFNALFEKVVKKYEEKVFSSN